MKKLFKKQDKEFERWEIHQVGCAFREKGKWIMLACDMNCKNVFDGVISKIREETLRAVREEVEKLRKELPTHTNGEYCIDSQDGCEECYDTYYNEALNDLLKSLLNH